MSSVIVQLDNIAYLRNCSGNDLPEPAHAAVVAQMAGAAGISSHLREDRQHINDRDIYILREVVKNRFILKIHPEKELLERAMEIHPEYTILMPPVSTSSAVNASIDFNNDIYFAAAESLRSDNLKTGCYIIPEETLIKEAARAKMNLVEFNIADFIKSVDTDDFTTEWERLEYMAQLAGKLGMKVSVGNGIQYDNIQSLLDIDIFYYISLGSAVINQALLTGFEAAVKRAVDLVNLSAE